MKKIVFLLWRDAGGDDLRDELLGPVSERLLGAGAENIVMNLRDAKARRSRSPAPTLSMSQPICAQVNVWLQDEQDWRPFADILRDAGFIVAGYLVEESIYKDYGENRHGSPRNWDDGERSPGISLITLMPRPGRIDRQEWIRRWHGTMSPVSEAIQPRTRYVRNLVQEKLTPGAPDYEGMVEEAWPSPRHVSNPFLFYGSRNPFGVLVNMARILRAVTSFLSLRHIRTVMLSEYFVKTGGVRSPLH